MDKMGADFFYSVQTIIDRLGKNAIPVQIPIGKESDFIGLIDLFEMEAYYYKDDKGEDIEITTIPDDLKELADKWHENLVEKICELDDDLMMMYLEGEEPSIDEMKKVLRRATIACEAVPVFLGSAYKNKGVQKMLDGVIEYMPAPTDIPDITGVDPDGNEVVRHSSDDEPFSALAFKIMTDPFVGKLAFTRIYSGIMNSGSYVLNSTKGKKERIGRLVKMHANHREEVESLEAGELGAIIGLKNTTTGDTLCAENNPIILESMEFPEPVINIAIEPKTKAGQEKMGLALAKLAEEDPTFKTWTDQETGQTIIAGMGELHLDIIVDRLQREFKVECNVGAPQVSYKETIKKAVKAEAKYAKQSGGKGQYGHAIIEMEPTEGEYSFENAVVGGAIPKEYIPAIDAGIQEAALTGNIAGYNVINFKVKLVHGSYHEVDSSEMAFKIAGSMAFKNAMAKADPVLLEPMMKVEITVPEEYMGDVIGDVNSRRGRLEGMDSVNGAQVIRAFIPLAEMFGYATSLRSRTQGRGVYAMVFDHYEEVPKSIQEQIAGNRSK